MTGNLELMEIAELAGQYFSLPRISQISNMSADSYYEFAKSIKKYCIPDFLSEAIDFPKFRDWCVYISRFNTCSIAPHPSELSGCFSSTSNGTPTLTVAAISPSLSIQNSSQTIANLTDCYDDYFCERINEGGLLFTIYGVLFSLLCSSGLFLNLACVIGFNKATNRCDATFYFTVIALLDNLYLGLKLPLKAVVHLSDVSYTAQESVYAQRAAYFIPFAAPLMTFCEVASIWLMVCLLVERYLYLRQGYFLKSVTSFRLHVRIICAVLLLSFCYIIPRFFEYKSVKNPQISNGYKVILTEMGNSTVYRKLVDYLLNVPIEMFIPYLAVGMLTSLVVSKLADMGSSAPFSNSSYCCCGGEFVNCHLNLKAQQKCNEDIADEPDPEPSDYISNTFSPPRLSTFEDSITTLGGTQVYHCGIPFEKRSDFITSYFLVPPPSRTIKETANVVVTACLGFLLLVTKVPKLILLALELEKYVELNPMLVRMITECLSVLFIVLKPPIYLIFGVHFRYALTGLCCCACLYAPVLSGNNLNNRVARQDGENNIESENAMDEAGEVSKNTPDARRGNADYWKYAVVEIQ